MDKKRLIESLVNNMTLAEKIGQLYQAPYSQTELVGPTWNNPDTENLIKKGMVGSILSVSDMDTIYKLQKMAVEESRLGIPMFFAYDIIRGYKTIFPIPLALSCSWDIKEIETAMRIVGKEASASGLHMTFSPMLDLVRDPRWGRVMESCGEDSYLTSLIGKAYIRGFQQGDLSKADSIAACAKHFIGYGAAEAGREYNTVDISRHNLYQYYLPPFRAAVNEGVSSVMTSFNVFEGIPATANRYLLKDVLRKDLDFSGVIISDYTSTVEILEHKIARDNKEVAEKCLDAGLDIEMVGLSYIEKLEELIAEKPEYLELLDSAIRRVLNLKYDMGLFENPYKGLDSKDKGSYLLPEYREKAREISEKSIVMLKNKGILPLKKEKKIALIGPYCDSKNILGFWKGLGEEKDCISLYEGMKNEGFKNIIKAEGVTLDQTEKMDDGLFEEALKVAQESDIVILCFGEYQYNTGEGASRTNLEMPGLQNKLAEKISELRKPTILLSFTGRPMMLDWYEKNMDAILQTWFLGVESGNAIAGILSGKISPSGKLTMTFPKNQGQIPIYYNHLKTGRPLNKENIHRFCSRYIDSSNEPLYPFGYGLTYGDVRCSDLKISREVLKENDEVTASIKVTNLSEVEITEVVQLYIEALYFSVSRPVKELKNFERVQLKAYESKEIHFKLSLEDFKFYNSDLDYVNENGEYKIYIGLNSKELQETKIIINTGR